MLAPHLGQGLLHCSNLLPMGGVFGNRAPIYPVDHGFCISADLQLNCTCHRHSLNFIVAFFADWSCRVGRLKDRCSIFLRQDVLSTHVVEQGPYNVVPFHVADLLMSVAPP